LLRGLARRFKRLGQNQFGSFRRHRRCFLGSRSTPSGSAAISMGMASSRNPWTEL